MTTNATTADPRVGDVHGSRSSDCTITAPTSARAAGSGRASRSRTIVASNATMPATCSSHEPPAATTTAEATTSAAPEALAAASVTAAAARAGEEVVGGRAADGRAPGGASDHARSRR